MPEISRFFGIVIRMFVEAGGPRHTPHFHAYYHRSMFRLRRATEFLHDDLDTVTLRAKLVKEPPVELWPKVVRRI